jgi:hypothetical protein
VVATDTRQKALDALQQGILAAVFGIVVWLACWPAARRQLDEYDATRELVTYLTLRDFSGGLPTVLQQERGLRQLTWKHCDATIHGARPDNVYPLIQFTNPCAFNEITFRAGQTSSVTLVNRLYVDLQWPQTDRFSVRLRKQQNQFINVCGGYLTDGADFFIVDTDADTILPFGSYELIHVFSPLRDRWLVSRFTRYERHDNNPSDQRLKGLPCVRIDDSLQRPYKWNFLVPLLRRAGVNPNLDKLSLSDTNVRALLERTTLDRATVNIFGIQLTLEAALAWISLFLGAVSLWTLGPLIAFRTFRGLPIARISILVIDTRSAHRGWLEIVLMALSVVLALLPITILCLQVWAITVHAGVDRWPVVVGVPAAFGASLVLASAAIELHRVRRNSQSDEVGS